MAQDYGEIRVMVGDLVKQRGLSASELSDLTGLSRPTCYKLIKGQIRRIELSTLARLVYLFEVPVGSILWYQEPGKDSGPGDIG